LRGAKVANSVVMHDSMIEPGAVLDHVIADKQTTVGRDCRIGLGDAGKPNQRFPDHLSEGLTIIGKNARIPAKIAVGTNCIIYPQVEAGAFPAEVIADGETVS
jgi:glucose-1-phosphate adenylyltransferase